VDEYTRECVALEVARSMTARRVTEILAGLFLTRGAPLHLRSDNGPEFIAAEVRRWLAQAKVDALYIEPGSPWENGYAESFHARLRDELLDREEFQSPLEARVPSAAWRQEYDHSRRHSSLGYQTPAAFARSCPAPGAGPLGRKNAGEEGRRSPWPRS
jgi:transposase InsO family protein